MALLNDDGTPDLPLRYGGISRANPTTSSGDELAWVGEGRLHASWLLTDQVVRDSASNDGLFAGIFFGAAAGFLAPTIEKVVDCLIEWRRRARSEGA